MYSVVEEILLASSFELLVATCCLLGDGIGMVSKWYGGSVLCYGCLSSFIIFIIWIYFLLVFFGYIHAGCYLSVVFSQDHNKGLGCSQCACPSAGALSLSLSLQSFCRDTAGMDIITPSPTPPPNSQTTLRITHPTPPHHHQIHLYKPQPTPSIHSPTPLFLPPAHAHERPVRAF